MQSKYFLEKNQRILNPQARCFRGAHRVFLTAFPVLFWYMKFQKTFKSEFIIS